MLKLVIADDEPMILKGLKKLIQGLDMDIQVIAEARDGAEAADKILSLKPDIAILDVAMPAKTGLDILKELANCQCPTQVIFLSGYKEFSYVKEAIQYGAVDYLLKPVEEEPLVQSLKKAASLLQDQSILQLFNDEDVDIRKIFRSINEGLAYNEEEFYQIFKDLGLALEDKALVCVDFYLSSESGRKLSNELFGKRQLVRFSVFNEIQEYVRQNNCGFLIRKEVSHSYQVFILPAASGREEMKRHIRLISQLIREKYGFALRAGIGDFIYDIRDLQKTYKTSIMARDFYYFLNQPVIFSEDIKNVYEPVEEEYEKSCEEILDHILHQRSQAAACIGGCLDLICVMHYGSRSAVVHKCISFSEQLHQHLVKYHLIEPEDPAFREYLLALPDYDTFAALKEASLQYYRTLLEQLYASGNYQDSSETARLVKYIEEHYAEDITLADLSRLACMNPYYVSSFFKKSTGKNFKTYLTEIRMKESIRLLLTTDKKVYEVAEAVGYHNVRQYMDKFKQLYGMSPSEYKNSPH